MFKTNFKILDSIPDAVIITEKDGTVVYANPATRDLFGYCFDEIHQQSINILLPANLREKHDKYIESFSVAPSARTMGTRINLSGQRQNGEEFPVDIMLNTIDHNNSFLIICVIRDMSSIKKTSDKLELALERESRLARHDPLTGVANRRLFEEHLNRVIKLSNRFDFVFTLAMLDIDDFKVINDRFGHSVGDEVLIQTARCIRGNLYSSDLVSRYGGDEFALLLEHSKATSAHSTVKKIHKALSKLYINCEWPISVSIGAICCDRCPESPSQLTKMVDVLLYTVKNTKKGQAKVSLMSSF